MSAEVVVRHACADDLRALAAAHLRSAVHAYAGIFPPDAPAPTLEQHVAKWATALTEPRCAVFAGEFGGMVVGGVIADPASRPGFGNLRHLYVHPDNWGRGVGRALHSRVVTWADEVGLPGIDLWVLEANARARSVYERWGWKLSSDDRYLHPGSGIAEVRYLLAMVTGP